MIYLNLVLALVMAFYAGTHLHDHMESKFWMELFLMSGNAFLVFMRIVPK